MTALYPLSPTKAGVWMDCRYRFFLQYVQRVPGRGRWAHLTMGNAIHAVLRDWFEVPLEARTAERVSAMMRDAWTDDGFRDAEQSARTRDRASAMTWRYVQGLDPQFAPRSCERSLGARTAAITITGRIDRLDEAADGSLVVVDYKTGRRPPDEDEARSSPALAAYVHCVRQSLRRPCSRVQLHHIPTASVVEWEFTDDRLARQLERLDRVGREASSTQAQWDHGEADVAVLFPPSPGLLCGWCDYRDLCAEGAAAAERHHPWDALPTDD